jgi:hypothetical protein
MCTTVVFLVRQAVLLHVLWPYFKGLTIFILSFRPQKVLSVTGLNTFTEILGCILIIAYFCRQMDVYN